jgi:hypothetical protein
LLNLNDEERLIWGKYLSTVANSRRQELEALDELLNEIGKPILEARPVQKPTEQQFNSLQWTTKTGTRGDYQQIENDKSQEFKILAEYVKSKGGFVNLHGFKVWLHNNNPDLIDRKR